MIEKPQSIARNPFKSTKWDEITEGRNFQPSDIPTLSLLCSWYEVIEKCMEDISHDGEIQVAYMNDLGFEYQSECHCAKTLCGRHHNLSNFEYQSECHCAKTRIGVNQDVSSLNTSQNVTAPKLIICGNYIINSLNTSQNVTAPKLT